MTRPYIRKQPIDLNGTKNPNCKLTPEQVTEIKRLKHEGFTLRAIGKLYEISHSQIDRIIKNKNWKNV